MFDVGEDEGLPWFSMEFIPGKSLEQLVREHPMDAREDAQCLRHVAEAVQHAHDHGVLHRDLKPSNILVDADEQPRITDFGIARIAGTDTTTSRSAQLTRTDVYGLGALLHHLHTGRPPSARGRRWMPSSSSSGKMIRSRPVG